MEKEGMRERKKQTTTMWEVNGYATESVYSKSEREEGEKVWQRGKTEKTVCLLGSVSFSVAPLEACS